MTPGFAALGGQRLTFSLRAQRESKQRERAPELRARLRRVRVGTTGFSHGASLHRGKGAHFLCAPGFAGLIVPASPPPTGPKITSSALRQPLLRGSTSGIHALASAQKHALALASLRVSIGLVWFATLGAMAGYLSLVGMADKKWFDQDHSVPMVTQLITVLSLALTGIVIGQLVRRAKSLAEEYAVRKERAAGS